MGNVFSRAKKSIVYSSIDELKQELSRRDGIQYDELKQKVFDAPEYPTPLFLNVCNLCLQFADAKIERASYNDEMRNLFYNINNCLPHEKIDISPRSLWWNKIHVVVGTKYDPKSMKNPSTISGYLMQSLYNHAPREFKGNIFSCGRKPNKGEDVSENHKIWDLLTDVVDKNFIDNLFSSQRTTIEKEGIVFYLTCASHDPANNKQIAENIKKAIKGSKMLNQLIKDQKLDIVFTGTHAYYPSDSDTFYKLPKLTYKDGEIVNKVLMGYPLSKMIQLLEYATISEPYYNDLLYKVNKIYYDCSDLTKNNYTEEARFNFDKLVQIILNDVYLLPQFHIVDDISVSLTDMHIHRFQKYGNTVDQDKNALINHLFFRLNLIMNPLHVANLHLDFMRRDERIEQYKDFLEIKMNITLDDIVAFLFFTLMLKFLQII